MATIRYKIRFNKNYFEKKAWERGGLVCGLDEVGRGCLAGPVMVGAVILKPHKINRLIKDSKLLNENEREKAYKWIIKNSWHAVSLVHNRSIDDRNIYKATLMAMRRAFLQLMAQSSKLPQTVLVDAMPLDLSRTLYEPIDVFHFPFGESKSSSIAAASIVAKVTRDRMMARLDNHFHGYDFTRNKGYATPYHKKAVRSSGYSVIHRINFLRGCGLLPKVGNGISFPLLDH